MSDDLVNLVFLVPPLLLAITLHEVGHGWVADRLGDPTAREAGRLSLNPLRHVDPIGTVVVPIAMFYLSSGLLFGWAKPVPVQPARLHSPRRDMALVALAGPGANLLMAIGWLGAALASYFVYPMHPLAAAGLYQMAKYGVLVNVLLMVLNLLPLPPLDGGRILVSALPPALARVVSRIEPFGIIVLVALLASGLLQRYLGVPLEWVQQVLR